MTRLPIALEMRFLRIPVEWSIKAHVFSGERYAVPTVQPDPEGNVTTVDGWSLRNKFLRMKQDETSALKFLNEVGVWNATERPLVDKAPDPRMELNGGFGSRLFFGRAVPVKLEGLWSDQRYWSNLLRSPSELKERLTSPPAVSARPADRLNFAAVTKFFNELPMHMEWRNGRPQAVVQTITGLEMLVATAHADLLRHAKFRICEQCGIPYPVTSRHKRKFCEWNCAHIVAVRKSRSPKNRKRKGE